MRVKTERDGADSDVAGINKAVLRVASGREVHVSTVITFIVKMIVDEQHCIRNSDADATAYIVNVARKGRITKCDLKRILAMQ